MINKFPKRNIRYKKMAEMMPNIREFNSGFNSERMDLSRKIEIRKRVRVEKLIKIQKFRGFK